MPERRATRLNLFAAPCDYQVSRWQGHEGRIVMKKRWALLTVLIALVSGTVAPLLLMQGVRAPLRLSLSCMLLSEAEKAGYLTPDKSRALVEKLAASPALPLADRRFVPQLGSECPKM